MFKKWIDPLRTEISGASAMNHARIIANYHRIQASPGYREAANYACEQLAKADLTTEIKSYPATPDVYYGNYRGFKEWRCREGELTVLTPERNRIARYTELEMSIIQRSTSTPPEGVTTELVFVDKAEEESSYEGIDVCGKIVLARGSQFRIYELAVARHGAIGLVLDNMAAFPPVRTREDLVDAIQYTSFWWVDEPLTCFGFAVSPRVGEELRRLCRQGQVTVHAKVDADWVDGTFENVEAFIPGQTNEEVLLVSHLCHPKPGGNDNASGPSVLIETARALQKLISNGTIPQPKRGIRFLMMPEMTGTHAYVASYPDRIKNTVAALNLDMVGADQKKGGGPLTVEKSSRSLPSYTAELAFAILEEVTRDVSNYSRTFYYSLTNYVATPFSGGSDHYILGDPSVGLPCPMIIQWPDKYYHTSMDSVDYLDPAMLEKVALTAAVYLYSIASADGTGISALAEKIASQLSAELSRLLEDFRDGKFTEEETNARLDFAEERKLLDLVSLQRIVPADDMELWADDLKRQLEWVEKLTNRARQEMVLFAQRLPQTANAATVAAEDTALMEQVFVRKHPGPIELRGFLRHLKPEEREHWHLQSSRYSNGHTLETFLQYWMDGHRTLAEVVELTALESGLRNLNYTKAYIELLIRLDLIMEAND